MAAWRVMGLWVVGTLAACRAPATSGVDAGMPTVRAPSVSQGAGGGAPQQDALRALALSPPPKSAERFAQQLEKVQANVTANPGKADLWVMLAEGWVRVARETMDAQYYVHARAAVDAALGLQPQHGLALGVKAMVELQDHRFSDARDLAMRATQVLPEDPLAYGVLSDAQLELGDVEAAESVTEKLMDLKPGLAAYTRASHLRWLRGDVDGARNVARLAIESAPPGEAAAFALCDAADMFFHLGDVDGAAEGYRMALQRLGDYPRALLGQARVALAHDKPAEALAPLGRALEVSPSAEAAWLLGDAHSLLKDAKAAQEAYARVEVLGRSDARTLAHYLAQSNQKLDHAWMLMERELKGRGDIHTLDVAAWVLHRQGKHKEALEHITRARRLGTREPRLQFHEGAIRLGLGDTTGRKLLEDVLKRHPGFDVMAAREARALLAAK